MNTEKVINHIVTWMLEYKKSSNCNGFILGISGGVDSAVTSTLCAKTNLQTLCLSMPIYQEKKQLERAENHIKWLKGRFKNISSIDVTLDDAYNSIKSTFLSNNGSKNYLALANTKARIRMMTLYYYAQINNLIVIGTGNKIEDFGIGFFTKYGDGGVDISPIGDLLKTEVYELAKTLNINDEIIDADPTDGLWEENKTDEDQIGASYKEIEKAMKFHGDQKMLSNREKEVLKIYETLNKKNQHKMKPIPVCKIPKNIK